jgi:hypothetical protein
MADDVLVPGTGATLAFDELTTVNGTAQGSPLPKAQRVKVVHGIDGAGTDASATSPLPTTDTTAQTALAAVLAKLTADPATQTSLAAVLAKITADPSTATAQATQATKLDTLHTDLAAVLAKVIGAPPTGAKKATTLTRLNLLATDTKLEAVRVLLAGTLTTELGATALAALESITIGTALPAGTNAIGTVDLAVGVPLAITDTATATASRYVGITIAETAGALAKVRVRNASVSGTMLDTITLQANESVSYTYPRGRSAASGTIYVQVVSGTVEGSVFTA